MLGKTVLVVDDDEAIREVLTLVLEGEGYRVVSAKNGADGLLTLQTELPAVVLLDTMMPVMDGREFKRVMDETPILCDIPVISCSANPKSNYYEHAKIAAYISKPFQVEELLAKISPFLQ